MKRIVIILSIVLFVVIGFVREQVFEGINLVLKWQVPDHDYGSGLLNFLNGFDYQLLYWAKWPLTIFTSVVYLGITLLLVRTLFANGKFIRYTLVLFISVYAIAIVAYGLGWMITDAQKGYTLARTIMDSLQSPLFTMMVIPGLWIAENRGVR